ncbi:MAG TPA: hypothetical protein VFA83_09615 [Acidimicrobiales bacterium]|nr:hypothetical protein [Acidimicrobiales bacterium]
MRRALCLTLVAFGLLGGATAALALTPLTSSASAAIGSSGTPAGATGPAVANGLIGTLCGIAGDLPGLPGKACKIVGIGTKVLGIAGKLLGLFGGGGGGGAAGKLAKVALVTAGLAAAGLWAAHGVQAALRELAHVISAVSSPDLTAGWFTADYLRIEEIAAVLTLPFLIAAVIHALIRSDPSLLVKATFGYVPACFLAINVAAPWTMMLLKLTDQMSGFLSAAGGDGGGRFLGLVGGATLGLSTFGGSTFLGLLLGIVIVAAAIALTLELLVREAAVYIIVLLLPLAFASMVWPARRIWAVRAVEVLVALILSKFVIVAIVSMAVSATSAGLSQSDLVPLFGGAALLLLAAAAPFTLLRMVPVVEASVVAHLEGVGRRAVAMPPAARQVAQSQVARMLDQRGGGGGAPTGQPGAVGGEPAPTAVATRGRDADGTQAAPDKPVPAASAWRNSVRVVSAAAGAPVPASAPAPLTASALPLAPPASAGASTGLPRPGPPPSVPPPPPGLPPSGPPPSVPPPPGG